MALTTINEISIRAKLIDAAKKKQFVGLARSAANTRFVFAKQDFIEEFDEHPVTQELNPENYDKEGSALVDHGNLLTFIGFDEGSDPAGELKKYLVENIQMAPEPKISDNGKNKIFYDFKVSMPSMTQIDKEKQFETPDNWRSTSWVSIIENGVSNAVYYVFAKSEETAAKFRKAGSRSGWGLQRPTKRADGGSFTPKKYISELIANFINKFN